MHATVTIPPSSHPPLLRVVSSATRVIVRFAIATVLGIATGLALTITVPMFLGGKALTVMSGSMEPVIHPGDVVITERIAPLDARVGDIVTFRSPESARRLLTHRVREIRAKGGQVYFATKGDAVNTVERWSVPANGRIGRTKFRVEKLGYAIYWINSPFGRTALFLIPLLVLLGYALPRIWRSGPGDDPPTKAVHPFARSSEANEQPPIASEAGAFPKQKASENLGKRASAERTSVLQMQRVRAAGPERRTKPDPLALLLLPILVFSGHSLVRRRSDRAGSPR